MFFNDCVIDVGVEGNDEMFSLKKLDENLLAVDAVDSVDGMDGMDAVDELITDSCVADWILDYRDTTGVQQQPHTTRLQVTH